MTIVTRRPLSLALLVLVSACGGPATPIQHPTGGPPVVTDDNYFDVERAYWAMELDDPARVAWRDALAEFLAHDSQEVLQRGDYDEIIAHLARIGELLTPEDVQARRVPAAVAPLARWVVEHGSSRGDEGRTMAALLLLAALGEEADAHMAQRTQIATWGRDARSGIEDPLERYGDMIEVWEQHDQLAPAPEVLETLARLYIEQRDALLGAVGPEGQTHLPYQEVRLAPLLMQRAPLDVAAVYLRHGDLASAIEHVQAMGTTLGVEERLIHVLSAAQEHNRAGAEALHELSRGFARARPDIAGAICRLGVRRHPEDARFPVCLARVALEDDDYAAATGWFAEGVRLAPEDRAVYDEALGRLEQIMEEGLFEVELAQSRSIGRHALAILEERERRFPESPASVTRDGLLLQIGRAEMNHGNLTEAAENLEASLAARDSREAHLQLGLLFERTARYDEAAAHYRAALDRTPTSGADDNGDRAEILEHLGDAFREAGQASQAQRMYRQALDTWRALMPRTEGPQRAGVLVRQGILRSRLGEERSAAQSFAQAMESAPAWREPYAAILSHLVVSAPNPDLAETVLRRAQFQLTLEPEWRVYFALWAQAIAGRASAPAAPEVTQVLHEMAEGTGWPSRLAAFGSGRIDFAELDRAASSRVEHAEALFYDGTRLLASGDQGAAAARFRQVLEVGMVSFFEYSMAQELLASFAAAPQVAETR